MMDDRESRIWRHRDDVLRILAVLWTMGGLGSRATIERSFHRMVARLLRPAEAAVRRLLVVLAQQIAVTLRPSRAAGRQTAGIRRRPDWMAFPLSDPLPRWFCPGEPGSFSGIAPHTDRQIGAARIAMRIDALFHALDDMASEARRLARWTALRKRARTGGQFCAVEPLRPGPPRDLTGRRGRRLKKHELYAILEDTHELAWWARTAPDDSS